jgi:hypothetical protein
MDSSWASGKRNDTKNPTMREYMENTKRDLIREGVRDGTFRSEQHANDLTRG